jgi:hypothetical protein
MENTVQSVFHIRVKNEEVVLVVFAKFLTHFELVLKGNIYEIERAINGEVYLFQVELLNVVFEYPQQLRKELTPQYNGLLKEGRLLKH